jgi:hypothetical protein
MDDSPNDPNQQQPQRPMYPFASAERSKRHLNQPSRTLSIHDGNNEASDDMEINARHNTQGHTLGKTTVANVEPPITPSQSPCRRSRDQMDDNEDFITATKKNKKNRQDSAGDDRPTDHQQKDQQHSPRHRYPTRLQYHQQGRDGGRQGDQESRNWSENQHTPQSESYAINVSTAATRYAITRFPFAPFVVRFSTNTIQETQIAKNLVKHSDQQHRLILYISNVRKSSQKCLPTECDYLIYVKTASSFAWLYNTQNWPSSLGSHNFTLPSMPSFPPQLSLVLKNVDLRTDVEGLAAGLKSTHPEIHNVIRLCCCDLAFSVPRSSILDRVTGRTMVAHHLQRIDNKQLYLSMLNGMANGKNGSIPLRVVTLHLPLCRPIARSYSGLTGLSPLAIVDHE